MAFKLVWITEDLPCDDHLLDANDDVTSVIWAGGSAITQFLLANDTDSSGHPFFLSEINGVTVVNGSIVVVGDLTVTVVDVITGEVTISLAAGGTASDFPYTIEDSIGVTASAQVIVTQGSPLAIVNSLIFNGPSQSFITAFGSVGPYFQAFVDGNGDGINDGSSGIVTIPGLLPVAVGIQNGSTATVEVYADAAGTVLLDSDTRRMPTPEITETEPSGGSPYIVRFANLTPDTTSSFFIPADTRFFVDIIISMGTYAGSYSLDYIGGDTPDISGLPVGLQAYIIATPDQLEFDYGLFSVEGTLSITVNLNVRHFYTAGAAITSLTAATQDYTAQVPTAVLSVLTEADPEDVTLDIGATGFDAVNISGLATTDYIIPFEACEDPDGTTVSITLPTIDASGGDDLSLTSSWDFAGSIITAPADQTTWANAFTGTLGGAVSVDKLAINTMLAANYSGTWAEDAYVWCIGDAVVTDNRPSGGGLSSLNNPNDQISIFVDADMRSLFITREETSGLDIGIYMYHES